MVPVKSNKILNNGLSSQSALFVQVHVQGDRVPIVWDAAVRWLGRGGLASGPTVKVIGGQ